ncbi:hypothetical protein KKB44_06680 [Candidatus Micrarchaeota archaeon]|nr:hypothetical protein [Candidatus Micrarchaeota archaeon]
MTRKKNLRHNQDPKPHIPDFFQQAKTSQYRRTIASLTPSKPSLIEPMLEEIQPETSQTSHYVHEMYLNGNWYVRMPMISMEERISIFQRAMTGLRPGQVDLALPSVPALFGPLVEKRTMGEHQVYQAALCTNVYGELSFASSQDTKQILLDMALILEDTVLRINLFRFCEPETPDSFALLDRRDAQGNMREILRRRVGLVFPDEMDFAAYERALNELATMRGRPNPQDMLKALLQLRFTGEPVHSTRSDDVVEHTINLCNHITKSSLIFEIALDIFKTKLQTNPTLRRSEIDLLSNLLSRIATAAYGSYHECVSRMFRKDAINAVPLPEHNTFYQTVVPYLVSRLFDLKRMPSTQEEGDHIYLTASDAELMQAAEITLRSFATSDQRLGITPEVLDSVKSQAEGVQKTNLFTRENLPKVVHVWKELFSPN